VAQIIGIAMPDAFTVTGTQTVLYLQQQPNTFFVLGALSTPQMYWVESTTSLQGIFFNYNLESNSYSSIAIPFRYHSEVFGSAYSFDVLTYQNAMLVSGVPSDPSSTHDPNYPTAFSVELVELLFCR
jgi:hypothetical protein